MRSLSAFLAIAAVMAAPLAAEAQQAGGSARSGAPLVDEGAAQAGRLDRLYDQLKRERNERAAQRIANGIREEWGKSGSATVDLLMQWAGKAIQDKKFDVALDFLDQVTVLAPDYAEGWNRRATLHFMRDDYAKAMTDIEHTLRLEPRHFGALAGMAAIFKVYDRKESALRAFERVLAVYPMLRSAQQEVVTISDELAGEGI